MSPRPLSRHRRPRWMVSGAFWTVLILADVAILSLWAALSTVVLALCGAGGYALHRRRRMLVTSVATVAGPSGAPVEVTTAPPPTVVAGDRDEPTPGG